MSRRSSKVCCAPGNIIGAGADTDSVSCGGKHSSQSHCSKAVQRRCADAVSRSYKTFSEAMVMLPL